MPAYQHCSRVGQSIVLDGNVDEFKPHNSYVVAIAKRYAVYFLA